MCAVRDFPVSGTGYGTYRFAYLPYQSHISDKRFYNADNQFLEWLVEGGFAGLFLVLLSILLIAVAVSVLLRQWHPDSPDPVGLVGLFAVVSQCISAFFDYGPSMPANMLALAAIMGAVTGRAALLAGLDQLGKRTWAIALPALRPSIVIPVLGIVLLIDGSVNLRVIQAAASTQRLLRDIPKLDSQDAIDEESVNRLIDRLSTALAKTPGDAEAHQALAELWVFRFRLQEFLIELDKRSEQKRSDIWSLTNPKLLYGQINIWAETGQVDHRDPRTRCRALAGG